MTKEEDVIAALELFAERLIPNAHIRLRSESETDESLSGELQDSALVPAAPHRNLDAGRAPARARNRS